MKNVRNYISDRGGGYKPVRNETLDRLIPLVYQELRRQASWHDNEIRFHHFRDRDGYEVDIVLERGARELAGVEVKLSASVGGSDFRGLRRLKESAGKRFVDLSIPQHSAQISQCCLNTLFEGVF